MKYFNLIENFGGACSGASPAQNKAGFVIKPKHTYCAEKYSLGIGAFNDVKYASRLERDRIFVDQMHASGHPVHDLFIRAPHFSSSELSCFPKEVLPEEIQSIPEPYQYHVHSEPEPSCKMPVWVERKPTPEQILAAMVAKEVEKKASIIQPSEDNANRYMPVASTAIGNVMITKQDQIVGSLAKKVNITEWNTEFLFVEVLRGGKFWAPTLLEVLEFAYTSGAPGKAKLKSFTSYEGAIEFFKTAAQQEVPPDLFWKIPTVHQICAFFGIAGGRSGILYPAITDNDDLIAINRDRYMFPIGATVGQDFLPKFGGLIAVGKVGK